MKKIPLKRFTEIVAARAIARRLVNGDRDLKRPYTEREVRKVVEEYVMELVA